MYVVRTCTRTYLPVLQTLWRGVSPELRDGITLLHRAIRSEQRQRNNHVTERISEQHSWKQRRYYLVRIHPKCYSWWSHQRHDTRTSCLWLGWQSTHCYSHPGWTKQAKMGTYHVIDHIRRNLRQPLDVWCHNTKVYVDVTSSWNQCTAALIVD